MSYARVKSADQLLLGYAEAITRLASAPAQRLALHPGRKASLFCATRECKGSPRLETDDSGLPVWKCSACRKLWAMEVVELGANETGRCRTGRSAFDETSGLRSAMCDFGAVLVEVERGDWLSFAAWTVHVLGPGPQYERTHQGETIVLGSTPTLGIPQEQVAGVLGEMARKRLIPAEARHVTFHRVRTGIRWARETTMLIVNSRRIRESVTCA